MATVRQLLGRKGHVVHTIAPGATVLEALDVMERYDIGALVVLADGEVVGMVSERDYARKVILKGRFSKDTPVDQIMSRDVVSVESAETVDGCMTLMTERRVRHLPVIENGQLAGMISIGDVVREIIESQKTTIDELQSYIAGSR